MESEYGDETLTLTKKNIDDARTLVAAVVIAGWTGTTYFSQWASMEATSGAARAGHAVGMIASASCCLIAVAIVLAVIVVNALDGIAYAGARRERHERNHPYSRDIRLISRGAGIR